MPWLSKQLRKLYWKSDAEQIEAYRQRLEQHLESKSLKPELQARLKYLSKATLEITGIRREKEQ